MVAVVVVVVVLVCSDERARSDGACVDPAGGLCVKRANSGQGVRCFRASQSFYGTPPKKNFSLTKSPVFNPAPTMPDVSS